MAGTYSDGSIVVDTGIDTRGFDRGSEDLRRAAESLSRGVERTGKKLRSAVNAYAKALASGNAGDIQRFSDGLKQAGDAAARFRSELEAFSKMTFQTDEYKEIQAHINSAQTALDALLDKQKKLEATGVKRGSSVWRGLEYDIQQAQRRLQDAQSDMNGYLESGGEGPFSGMDTAQFEEYSERLEELREQIETVGEEAQRAFRPPRLERWDNMITLSGMIRGAFDSVKNTVLTFAHALAHPLETLDRLLGNIVQTAGHAGTALLRMAGGAVFSGLRRIGGAASETARDLAKMTARAVTGGIRRLGGWLSNAARSMLLFGRSSKKTNGTLKRGFLTILRYGLGIRSLYFLFNKIRTAIKEGFQNLARYSNASLSSVLSSFTRMKNALAAAFAPMVNIAGPALSGLIDSLSAGTEKLGDFLAAVTGQKTVVRAKEVQQDYAESLRDTQKAAEEARKQLAGFDELNILKENNQEQNEPEDMFETVPVEQEAEDFAETVREAWEDIDLSGIGGIIGAKIKIAIDDMPWAKIRQAAANTGKRLATFLNGLIDTPKLGGTLGDKIAKAVNSAFAFVDGFSWDFDWAGLGEAIVETVESAIDNLNWTQIHSAVRGVARGLADLLNAVFARESVWRKAGDTLGRAVNTLVDGALTFLRGFSAEKAGAALGAGLNGIVDVIRWDNIGEMLGEAIGRALAFINTTLSEFSWTKAGEGLAAGVNGLVTTLAKRTKELNWEEVGAKAAEGINRTVEDIQWDEAGSLLGTGFQSAVGTLATFIRTLSWKDLTDAIGTLVKNAVQQVNFQDLITVWGVAAVVTAVKRIILEHPVQSLIVGALLAMGPETGSALKNMLDTVPWAEVGQKLSDLLIDLFTRLSEAMESVEWDELGEDVGTKLGEMLANVDWTGLIGSLGALLVELFGGAVEFLLSAIGGIFSELGEKLEETGHDVIGGFFKGIGDVLTGIGTWIKENVVDPFVNWFKKLFGIASPSKVMAEIGKDVINGLYQGMLDVIANVGTWVKNNIITPIVNAFKSTEKPILEFKAKLTEWTEALKNKTLAFVANVASFTDAIKSKTLAFVANIASFTDAIKSKTLAFVANVASFTDAIKEKALAFVANIASFTEAIKSKTLAFVANVASFTDAIKNKVLNFTAKIVSWAESTTNKVIDFIANITEKKEANTLDKSIDVTAKASSLDSSAVKGSTIEAKANFTTWSNGFNPTNLESKRPSIDSKANFASYEVGFNTANLESKRPSIDSKANFASYVVGFNTANLESKRPSIDSKANFSTFVNSLTGSKAPSVDSDAKFTSFNNALTGNKAPSIDSGAKFTSFNNTLTGRYVPSIDVVANITSINTNTSKATGTISFKENGGVLSGGIWHNIPQFASGGIIRALGTIQQYAGGTLKTGSMFVAGEAGPEVVGHINGRTEVLNKSQIASAIYSAVLAGMEVAVNGLGRYIASHMTACTNAVISALVATKGPSTATLSRVDTALLQRLTALSGPVSYPVPAYATGTVMPYEVAAEIRRQTSELKAAIREAAEEIIRANTSAISNHGMAVTQAIGNIQGPAVRSFDQMSITDNVIDEINRRTQMMGFSPLLT